MVQRNNKAQPLIDLFRAWGIPVDRTKKLTLTIEVDAPVIVETVQVESLSFSDLGDAQRGVGASLQEVKKKYVLVDITEKEG